MAHRRWVPDGPARRRTRVGLPLAVAVLAVFAAPAGAAPVFAPLTTLGTDAAETAVATTPAGGGLVAWAGRDGGVYVRLRLPGIGLFAPAVLVSTDRARELCAAANDRGDLALAWTRDGGPAVRAAVAPAGTGFGTAQTVGPGDRPALAVGAEGSVTVAYVSAGGAVSAALRAASESFGPAQVLDSRTGAVSVVADGIGITTVAWASQGNDPRTDPAAVRTAQRVTGQTAFSGARVISDASAVPASVAIRPALAAGFRGDLLVSWAGAGAAFSAVRPAGRDWAPAERLQPVGETLTPQLAAALNDRGDAALAGFGGAIADLAFRPAGAALDPVRKTLLDAGPPAPGVVTLDAVQDSVHVVREGREPGGGSPGFHVTAIVRRASAPLGRTVRLTPALAQVSPPALSAETSGSGLIAWTSGGLVQAVAYGQSRPAPLGAAPRITRVEVERRSLRFRIDQPALVRFAVSTRGARSRRSAEQSAVARAGVNRIAFGAGVRRVLRRPGRYTVVVRASSARTKTGRKTHRFRRRSAG